MRKFFAELKRRHVYRVGAAYAVIAWVLLQLVNNVAPILELPPFVARAVLLILVLGFPVALILAWMFDATPQGLKRTPPPDDGTVARGRHSLIDGILAGALVIVIALVSYQQLASSPGAGTREAGIVSGAAPPASGISIAVLPFANLSEDRAQEFFSDGMTEEINTALAKIPNLLVVARASAFQFKGERRDIRAVGQALSARYLIDGSVRKAGTRVRITAQLIEANNGLQIWTDSYDRELTDVFAIQEDIAQAIASALRLPLGLQQGERLVSNRTSDLDSYQQYLRARALYRARAIDDAIGVLEPVVARDPEYAPAWALLAQAYVREPTYGPLLATGSLEDASQLMKSFLDRGERAAREAIRLDPRHSGGYVGLALLEMYRGKGWSAAEDFFRQALALDPNDPDALHAYSTMLADAGYVKEGLPIRSQLRTLEPFVPVYNTSTAQILLAGGDHQAAIQVLLAVTADTATGYARNTMLARAYAAEGRYAEAADALLTTPPTVRVPRESIEDAARLLRAAAAKTAPAGALPELGGYLGFVYAYAGAPDRVLDYYDRMVKLEFFNSGPFELLWSPEYAALRKTERFKAIVRAWGFPDYWRERGWPDLCRPVGADDFVCD